MADPNPFSEGKRVWVCHGPLCYNARAALLAHPSLTTFRNFIRLEADVPEGSTLLLGANAPGKNSLHEAIF